MEKLRIEEIIDHCNRKVKWWEKLISREKFENRDANDSSDREYWEHRQVAEYLKELQQYRAIGLSPELIEAMQGHNVALIEQLAEYQDAEKQGLLFRIPCKIGDTIFKIPSKVNYRLNVLNGVPEWNKIYEQTVWRIELGSCVWYATEEGMDGVRQDNYKKTWFLTREEAEAALEKMKVQ